MRTIFVIHSMLLLTTITPTAAQDLALGKGSLSGTVTSRDGRPLSGARVTLASDPTLGASPASVNQSAISDERGKYTLEDVAPGSYILVANAEGYIRQPYGGKPGYFGTYNGRALPYSATPVAVLGGQSIGGLDVKLTLLSAISGRILTSDGAVAQGVPVYAVRWTYLDGGRKLLEQGRATSDDRGNFKISGLAPGEYYVYAVPRGDAKPGAGTRTASPTYAPSALHHAEAVALPLTAGGDGFADVRLRDDAVFRVQGRIVGAQRDQPLEGAVVLLTQAVDTPIVGGIVGAPDGAPPPLPQPYLARASAGPDGEFSLPGIVAGNHHLVAFGGKSPVLNASSEGMRLSLGAPRESVGPDDGSAGAVDLVVRNEDAKGITVLLRPGGDITVQISMDNGSYQDWARARLEGSSTTIPEDRRARMVEQLPQVNLLPVEGVAGGGLFAMRPGDPRSFTQRVTPGRYFVDVNGNNRLFYIKSIRLGSEDMTRRVFDYRGGVSATLEIVLGTDAGVVKGIVTDERGMAARGASVSLWPLVPDNSQRNGGVMATSAGHDGTFTFPLVPPGEYGVVAYEDLPDPGLAQYPPFVARLASKRVKVEPKQRATVTVRVVAAQEVQRALTSVR